jgi:hypothetical protein
MKRHSRHLRLLVSLSCTVFAASLSLGQECPCTELGEDGYREDHDPVRPDFTLGPPIWDSLERGFGNNVAACSGPFCGYACRSEGLFFSTESFLADVEQNNNNNLSSRLLQLHTPAAPAIGGLEPDLDPTIRFRLGRQTCDGLGVQASYWEYDNAASMVVAQVAPADPNLVLHALDVKMFEVEVVMNSMVNQVWDTTLSGGYRFAHYEEEASLRLDNAELAMVRTRYTGNGITGAVGVRRQVLGRLSFMSYARGSLLFGNSTINATGVALPPNPLNNPFDSRYTLESQLGASYEHPICGGGLWFVRGGYELQYWNDFVVPVGGQTDPTSTLFRGFFFAIGLQR